MEPTNLGNYLKKVRQERGMSVRSLAGAAKVDATWLSKVERGIYATPDPRSLYRLASVLGIETADLYLEAGYGDGRGLPGFAPYLRSKFDLPDEAVAQLEAHFDLINERYRQDRDGAV